MSQPQRQLKKVSDGSAWSGAFQLTASTHPKAAGPLAATPECDTPGDYRELIRQRYRCHAGARQQIAVLARRLSGRYSRDPLEVTGPFAAEAREILTAVRGQLEEVHGHEP